MKKLILSIQLVLVLTATVFGQIVENPNYFYARMGGYKLTKVYLTSSETKLFFNGPSSSGFSIADASTLTTNNGQKVRLLRCEGLSHNDRKGIYQPDYNTDWFVMIFPGIENNAASVDYSENASSSGSYFCYGIDLKRTGVSAPADLVENPNYVSAKMYGYKLAKVYLTSSETKLIFEGASSEGFSIGYASTLTTNTGQKVRLLRCEGLIPNDRQNKYDAPYTSWYVLVFQGIDYYATSIDYQENANSSGSFFYYGIDLKRGDRKPPVTDNTNNGNYYNNNNNNNNGALGYQPPNTTLRANACEVCSGSGKIVAKVTCNYCKGSSGNTCSYCHGSGKENCNECSGKGTHTCYVCNGNGIDPGIIEVGANLINMIATGADYQQQAPQTCPNCLGSGSVTCKECHGTGGKICTVCNGRGHTTVCSYCNGQGSQSYNVTCPKCNGTGNK